MYYQQGDVLLKKVSEVEKNIKSSKKVSEVVLAEGEVTGHSHILSGTDLLVLEDDMIDVQSPSKIVHEEHSSFTIDPGLYKKQIVREYDHFEEEARQVRD